MKNSLKCAAMAAGMFECASIAHAQTATFVQVNVNASGQNIVGDAANEPSIAVDPTNPSRMAIGWRQFNTISSNFRQAGVAYTTNGGQTWTASVLRPGQFRSDPVLRSDANGIFYFASLNSETAVDVFKSSNGGASWGGPVSAFGGDKEWIAIDTTNGPGRGNIYQNWNVQFSTGARYQLYALDRRRRVVRRPDDRSVPVLKGRTTHRRPERDAVLGWFDARSNSARVREVD